MYNILTATAAAVTNHNPIRVEKVVCIRFWCNFFSSAPRGRRRGVLDSGRFATIENAVR